MRSVPLSPQNREAALAAMGSQQLDILVIGGGVVGGGAALDAAERERIYRNWKKAVTKSFDWVDDDVR